MSGLLAEREVIARANDLFLCTDRKDWQCVKDVFAPQVLFDMTSLAGGQPATLSGNSNRRYAEQFLYPDNRVETYFALVAGVAGPIEFARRILSWFDRWGCCTSRRSCPG